MEASKFEHHYPLIPNSQTGVKPSNILLSPAEAERKGRSIEKKYIYIYIHIYISSYVHASAFSSPLQHQPQGPFRARRVKGLWERALEGTPNLTTSSPDIPPIYLLSPCQALYKPAEFLTESLPSPYTCHTIVYHVMSFCTQQGAPINPKGPLLSTLKAPSYQP